MASKLDEFVKAERELKRQMQELERLKKSKAVQKELQFKNSLEALMKKHGKTWSGLQASLRIIEAADGKGSAPTRKAPQKTLKPRKLKVYTNPFSGERVETRGANHKTLKAWKEEYGRDTVESWAEVAG